MKQALQKKDIVLKHALDSANWRPAWSKISKATGISVSTVYDSLRFERFEVKVKHVPRKQPLKCMNPACKNTVKTKGWCSAACAATFGKGDEC